MTCEATSSWCRGSGQGVGRGLAGSVVEQLPSAQGLQGTLLSLAGELAALFEQWAWGQTFPGTSVTEASQDGPGATLQLVAVGCS